MDSEQWTSKCENPIGWCHSPLSKTYMCNLQPAASLTYCASMCHSSTVSWSKSPSEIQGVSVWELYVWVPRVSTKIVKTLLSIPIRHILRKVLHQPLHSWLVQDLQVKGWNEKGLICYDVIWWCDWWILMGYVRFKLFSYYDILVDLNYSKNLQDNKSHMTWSPWKCTWVLSKTEPLTRLAPRKVSNVPDLSGVCCSSENHASREALIDTTKKLK